MTQEELERYLHSLGWHLDVVPRRSRGKLYAYAKQRRGGKIITKYLCPFARIDALDETTVAGKLR